MNQPETPSLYPNPEEKKPTTPSIAIYFSDAKSQPYEAGLKRFAGVAEMLRDHPELSLLLEKFNKGEVVLRGFHRFFDSEQTLDLFIQNLQQTGVDRSTEQISHTGENLHVVASFVNDDWSLVLPYSVESLTTKRPPSTNHSVGFVTFYDNTDGRIVYIDSEKRAVYTKHRPSPHEIDMYARDNNMKVAIAANEANEKTALPDRLVAVAAIEYPLLNREDRSLFDRLKGFLT